MGIEHTFNKFAEDSRGSTDILKDRSAIQKNLYILEKWAKKDLEKFSKGKYEVLHLGHSNPMQHYKLEDS